MEFDRFAEPTLEEELAQERLNQEAEEKELAAEEAAQTLQEGIFAGEWNGHHQFEGKAWPAHEIFGEYLANYKDDSAGVAGAILRAAGGTSVGIFQLVAEFVDWYKKEHLA